MTRLTSSGKATQVSLTPEQIGLKRQFAEVVKGCGGLEAAEMECRVTDTQLQRYCSANVDAFPTLDVIADLEPLASGRPGWPHVTSHLARHLGFSLVPIPTVDADDCTTLHAALAASMRKKGERDAALMDALGDSKVTAEEAVVVAKIAMEALEEDIRLHAILKRIAEEC